MAADYEKIVDYMVMVVDEYADEFGITPKEAFDRLYVCGAMDALEDQYEIEHTLPLSSTIDALDAFYRRESAVV